MANCKQCGQPLKKGNIKFVRKPGKRPYRVCRRCRYPERVEITRVGDKRRSFVRVPSREDGRPDLASLPPEYLPQGAKLAGYIESTGNALQRPQVSTGDPIVVEGILEHLDPPRYRYFMIQEQAARVKLAVERAWGALGIGFEVIPVPEDQVERAPEDYADLVEVTVEWKVE